MTKLCKFTYSYPIEKLVEATNYSLSYRWRMKAEIKIKTYYKWQILFFSKIAQNVSSTSSLPSNIAVFVSTPVTRLLNTRNSERVIELGNTLWNQSFVSRNTSQLRTVVYRYLIYLFVIYCVLSRISRYTKSSCLILFI